MKYLCVTALLLALMAPAQMGAAQNVSPKCEELIALFIELGRRSGETVTRAQALAEVMSENPSDHDCAAMMRLFAGRLGG